VETKSIFSGIFARYSLFFLHNYKDKLVETALLISKKEKYSTLKYNVWPAGFSEGIKNDF
jgi:hypothetical protein